MSSNEAAIVNLKYPKRANICKPYYNYDNVDSKATLQLYFSETVIIHESSKYVGLTALNVTIFLSFIWSLVFGHFMNLSSMPLSFWICLWSPPTLNEYVLQMKQVQLSTIQHKRYSYRITMTGMTGNVYQQYVRMFSCQILHFVHHLLATCVCLLGMQCKVAF